MPENPPQIFIAHANEDKAQVRELYAKLVEAGYKPWFDEEDLLPGQNWREEIPKALKNSDLFIACLSSTSISKRGYIQREFKMAMEMLAELPPGTIFVIPLKFDDCEIPELRQSEYGLNLRDIQWLDYWKPNGFEKLVKSIEHQFGSQGTEQRGTATGQGELIDRELLSPSSIPPVINGIETPINSENLQSIVVVLDPGHGGQDLGGVAADILEKDLTLKISQNVANFLRQLGLRVKLTRTDDQYISLRDRVKFAEKEQASVFVSIHVNASGGRGASGIETYYSESSEEGRKLAKTIQNSIINFGGRDRGTKPDTMLGNAGLRILKTSSPSVVVEVGFIDSSTDRLNYPTRINEISQTIAYGIRQYLQHNLLEETKAIDGKDTATGQGGSQPSIIQDHHGSGDNVAGNKTVNNHYSPSQKQTANDGNSEALELWQEKLTAYRREEAIAADPEKKFQLKQLIKECQQKIGELGE